MQDHHSSGGRNQGQWNGVGKWQLGAKVKKQSKADIVAVHDSLTWLGASWPSKWKGKRHQSYADCQRCQTSLLYCIRSTLYPSLGHSLPWEVEPHRLHQQVHSTRALAQDQRWEESEVGQSSPPHPSRSSCLELAVISSEGHPSVPCFLPSWVLVTPSSLLLPARGDNNSTVVFHTFVNSSIVNKFSQNDSILRVPSGRWGTLADRICISRGSKLFWP